MLNSYTGTIQNPIPFFIPERLKSLPNWVVWRTEERKDGTTTKVPYSAVWTRRDGSHYRASSTKPDSWTGYDNAHKCYLQGNDFFKGLGFVVSEESGLVFIDCDHCIDDEGHVDDRGRDILESFPDCYAEVSQSGHGIHVFAVGAIPRCFKNSKNGVEMYSHSRFCAMTGNAIQPFEPSDNPEGLAYTFDRYKTPDKVKPPVARESVSFLTDETIIEKCEKSEKTGNLFHDLYAGNYSQYFASQSEADLALCALLTFWADRDEGTIDRIFRTSGLYRAKWLRDDYRQSTLDKAIATCPESVSEFIERKRREDEREFEKLFLLE